MIDMKQKSDAGKTWIYVLALAVIVILMMVFFGDSVNFSPKDSDDSTVSASDMKLNDLFNFNDDGMDSVEKNVLNALNKAKAASEGEGK